MIRKQGVITVASANDPPRSLRPSLRLFVEPKPAFTKLVPLKVKPLIAPSSALPFAKAGKADRCRRGVRECERAAVPPARSPTTRVESFRKTLYSWALKRL